MRRGRRLGVVGGRVRRGAVLGCAALVVLSGCTDEPDEAVTPSVAAPAVTATPSPTPSATPTPTVAPEAVAPEVPEAMQLPGPDGAAAAAEYFLSLYPYAYATGDLTQWQAMSHPECIFCASVVTHVQEQVAAGQHTTGGLLTFDRTDAVEVSAAMSSVRIEVREATEVVLNPDGSEAARNEGHAYVMTLILLPGETWTIREVQVDELPAT